jgi:hypothetical protein
MTWFYTAIICILGSAVKPVVAWRKKQTSGQRIPAAGTSLIAARNYRVKIGTGSVRAGQKPASAGWHELPCWPWLIWVRGRTGTAKRQHREIRRKCGSPHYTMGPRARMRATRLWLYPVGLHPICANARAVHGLPEGGSPVGLIDAQQRCDFAGSQRDHLRYHSCVNLVHKFKPKRPGPAHAEPGQAGCRIRRT